jgi:DNA-binding SARP family transcriptional activator
MNEATLHLLEGPHVHCGGRRIEVPEGSKRLVAFVALKNRRVERAHAAEVLWPDVDRTRASGNLRSAMWRLRCAEIDILDADKCSIFFQPKLRVDLEDVTAWAHRLATGKSESVDLDFQPLALRALDLLPGWYDDWVQLERERLRQQLVRALEALSRLLIRANRCGEAIEAALTAVSVEPLRESAQGALIEAHLAEGNRCEAIRSFALYEDTLVREFGVGPSSDFGRLLSSAVSR